jgi:2,4-dienoyl-CoA reductase-like NADH-dependent reductase (Old Yellow Enzyme family)
MSLLFSRLEIKDIELRNRIMVSPMCQYSSTDGFATDWHLVHLGSRAVGGAAIVMQEATAVSAEGRISPDDMGIYQDAHMEKLKRIVDFIQAQGAVPGIQLAHAGRKASHASPWKGGRQISPSNGGWLTMAPSEVPFADNEQAPVALNKQGIQKVIDDFSSAARRAAKVGYRVIEIHAAHGYLLHQFLSPLSNRRDDEYGGSLENRSRILIAVIESVKKEWNARYPLFVRISATDWTDAGWSIDDSLRLSSLLKAKGVDLIDCSSGGISPKINIPVAPGYQVPFAEQIKKEAEILTGAVGLITSADQAEEILISRQADIIIFARQLLRDPYFPLRAAHMLREDISWPQQYERAKINF